MEVILGMPLIQQSPVVPGDIVVSYNVAYFDARGQFVESGFGSDASYGIELWYNEYASALWAAQPVVPVWIEDGVEAPLCNEPIYGSSPADVILAAHVIAHSALQDDTVLDTAQLCAHLRTHFHLAVGVASDMISRPTPRPADQPKAGG